MDMKSLEDYTYVTIHAPNQSFTKVYYDGGEHGKQGHDRRCENMGCTSVPKGFPARLVEDVPVYPTSDFLSSCHLCRKKLYGRDIYIYRYSNFSSGSLKFSLEVICSCILYMGFKTRIEA
jgi:hypothetical protein